MTAENRATVTPTEMMAATRRVLSEVLEVFMIVDLSGRFFGEVLEFGGFSSRWLGQQAFALRRVRRQCYVRGGCCRRPGFASRVR